MNANLWPILLFFLASSSLAKECWRKELAASLKPSDQGLPLEIVGIKRITGLDIRVFENKRTFTMYKVLDDEGEIAALLKPEEGGLLNFFSMTDPLTLRRTIEAGGKINRDVASLELSKAFQLDLLPNVKTVSFREYRATKIDFLDGFVTGKSAPPNWRERVKKEDVQSMYLFDMILGHQDRHLDNVMINENGVMKLIDNDLVLHKEEGIRWRNSTDLRKDFPQGTGEVEPEVRDKFISLSDKDFMKTLWANGMPEESIKYALARFHYVKKSLQENRKLESILDDFSNMARVSCRKNESRRECMKRIKTAARKALIYTGSATAGVASFFLLEDE